MSELSESRASMNAGAAG